MKAKLEKIFYCAKRNWRSRDELAPAEAAVDRAIQLFDGLLQTNRSGVEHELAIALNSRGVLREAIGKTGQAVGDYRRALEIERPLYERNPDAYDSDFIKALRNLARLYQKTNQLDQAETLLNEAILIERGLWQRNRKDHSDPFADLLLAKAEVISKGRQDLSDFCDCVKEAAGVAAGGAVKTKATALWQVCEAAGR